MSVALSEAILVFGLRIPPNHLTRQRRPYIQSKCFRAQGTLPLMDAFLSGALFGRCAVPSRTRLTKEAHRGNVVRSGGDDSREDERCPGVNSEPTPQAPTQPSVNRTGGI